MTALLLLGCDSQKWMNIFVPEEGTKAGQAFIEDIRTGNLAPVQAAIDPVYRTQLDVNLLRHLQGLFGNDVVKSVKIIGSHSLKTPAFTRYGITYEYELAKHWVIAEVVLQPSGGHLQIEGIHAQQSSQSVEQINTFTLSGKSPTHLVFVCLATLFPIFVVWTAIVCWRTLIPRRKWFWRIFVLLGITGFTLNWTTGDLQFLPIHFDLLGAGFSQQLYGPAILEISLPFGAALFWLRRRRWQVKAEADAISPG